MKFINIDSLDKLTNYHDNLLVKSNDGIKQVPIDAILNSNISTSNNISSKIIEIEDLKQDKLPDIDKENEGMTLRVGVNGEWIISNWDQLGFN